MEENKEIISQEKKSFMIISLLFVFALILGISFAYFMAQGQSEEQVITTAKLSLNFSEGNIIRATNISPIDDSQIKTEATELPFSITNTGDQHMKLTIKLTDITLPNDLKNVDFRWGLYNADTNKGVSFGIFKNTTTEEILLRDVILDQGSAAKNYILRVWIHDTGSLQEDMMGETFKAKVTVTGDIVEYTPESCFTFDSSTGTITGYKTNSCPTQNVDMVIPKSIGGVTVTKIGDYVFKDDDDVKVYMNSVIIPDTITSIGEGGFGFNSLSHITIPESLTTNNTFILDGNPLTSITIPENITNIDIINSGISAPKTVILPGTITNFHLGSDDIENIILMDGITIISNYAFAHTGITSVEIPSSVTIVETGAFAEVSTLTEIIVRGKSSLSEFTDSTGLTEAGDLPSGITIKFPDA